MMREEEIDRITPQRAMELLRKDGIDVDREQAKIILEFLYEMAEIVVDTYLEEQKKRRFTSPQQTRKKV
jgi:protein-tyrosine-phosphatase